MFVRQLTNARAPAFSAGLDPAANVVFFRQLSGRDLLAFLRQLPVLIHQSFLCQKKKNPPPPATVGGDPSKNDQNNVLQSKKRLNLNFSKDE